MEILKIKRNARAQKKKKTVTEIKNAFDGLRKESLCLKICGSFKNWEVKRKKPEKIGTEHPRQVRQLKRCNMCLMRLTGGDERKEQKNIWSNHDWEFPPINVRHQTTDPGSWDHQAK